MKTWFFFFSLEKEIKFLDSLFNDIFLDEIYLNLESRFSEFECISPQVLLF